MHSTASLVALRVDRCTFMTPDWTPAWSTTLPSMRVAPAGRSAQSGQRPFHDTTHTHNALCMLQDTATHATDELASSCTRSGVRRPPAPHASYQRGHSSISSPRKAWAAGDHGNVDRTQDFERGRRLWVSCNVASPTSSELVTFECHQYARLQLLAAALQLCRPDVTHHLSGGTCRALPGSWVGTSYKKSANISGQG